MKQTISNKSVITFFSLFIAFTALSLATQIRSSFAGTNNSESLCQTSQRGIRCGNTASKENSYFTSSEIDQLLAQIEQFCSTSARGMRCVNKKDVFTNIQIKEIESSLSEKSSCVSSARGTRCSNNFS